MVRIQVRRDIAANWTSNNPTLLAGEFGYETDTKKYKLGDGTSTWDSLGYANHLSSQQDVTISSLQSGQVLQWNGSAWVNVTPSTGGATDHTLLSNIGTNTHDQIDTFITSKGATNGLASLGADGKVPTTQLPASVVGALEYKGTHDCSGAAYPSNPELGWYYICSVAGTISTVSYEVGDWMVYNGTSWDKIDNTDTETWGGIARPSFDDATEGSFLLLNDNGDNFILQAPEDLPFYMFYKEASVTPESFTVIGVNDFAEDVDFEEGETFWTTTSSGSVSVGSTTVLNVGGWMNRRITATGNDGYIAHRYTSDEDAVEDVAANLQFRILVSGSLTGVTLELHRITNGSSTGSTPLTINPDGKCWINNPTNYRELIGNDSSYHAIEFRLNISGTATSEERQFNIAGMHAYDHYTDYVEVSTISKTDHTHSNYILTPSGLAQGDILFFDGTNISKLTAGQTGQVLITGGSGANPSWSGIDGGSST